MKLEQGLIIAVKGNIAEIKVGRHSDCTSCGACPGSNSVIITANNKIGAKAGQRVEFAVKEVNVLLGAFTVFVWPLLAALLGVLAGRLIVAPLGYDLMNAQISGGVAAFLLSLVFVKFFDKSAAGSEQARPDILRIL